MVLHKAVPQLNGVMTIQNDQSRVNILQDVHQPMNIFKKRAEIFLHGHFSI